ncbi:outer membrane beta-barrel protein [Natronoflexus pectinivorans]|uniref:Outer membrane protein with beta-barrel domain n=1 Tax=Natronoflexus pectinivorans TaxID=682526 RepID=A0A4R2GN43_9BACT|nr:outer membrane beta-barrel protein [Natronoflexus pectinivorans]TCO10437.1 outer membrane protein with beta-barrel domain [Natronoflexus pectinivorans]
MKRVGVLFLFFISLLTKVVNCNAQDLAFSNRLSVGAYISDCPLERYSFNSSRDDHSNIIGVFVDYKFTPTLSGGVYGGYNNMFRWESVWTGSNFRSWGGTSPTYHFGLQYKVHLMPLIVPVRQSRIDLYSKAKLGRVVSDGDRNVVSTPPRTFTDYGVYAGMAFYLFGNFGLFAEYGFGVVSEKTFGLTKRF